MLRARADRGEKAIKLMCFFEELPVTGVGLVSLSVFVDCGSGSGMGGGADEG